MANVLIIEDNDQVAELYREWLTGAGHTVDHAADAYGAVERLVATRYDIVLMDLLIPGANGAVTALALRGISAMRGDDPRAMPIVVVTGNLMPITPEVSDIAEFAGRMVKPIKGQELLDEVDRQLEKAGLGPVRVLIVDDDVQLGMIISKSIAADGFVADVVGTGEEAIEKLRSHRYAAAIIDILLPGIDGAMVASRIREIGLETPLIAMTGADLDATALYAAGFASSLGKPIGMRDLLAALHATVGKK